MVIATAISVYPNPFDHFVTLEVTCEENQDCIILLADLQQSKIIRMMGAGLGEVHGLKGRRALRAIAASRPCTAQKRRQELVERSGT